MNGAMLIPSVQPGLAAAESSTVVVCFGLRLIVLELELYLD